MRRTGFAPIAHADARVLILGSMPSQASLAAGRYYAHPRNAFWPIMSALLGLDPEAGWEARYRALAGAGLALWDVCHACIRPGSLDADIREVEPNDFAGFYAAHPGIRHVFFNGAKAMELYRRLVLPGLDERWRSLPLTRLPSTSPAHAAMRPEDKLSAWRRILEVLNEPA